MSKVIKAFGEPGVVSVLKELKQLHDRMFMDPKNLDEITKCQKKLALQYLIFLKQKRCGKINGRRCVDGRIQRKYLIKYDTIAQTISTEALFLMFLIDAMEHWEVATMDIPGEFIQSDMEGETVHIKMEGKMVDILTKLDPKSYCKYIRTDKVRPVS